MFALWKYIVFPVVAPFKRKSADFWIKRYLWRAHLDGQKIEPSGFPVSLRISPYSVSIPPKICAFALGTSICTISIGFSERRALRAHASCAQFCAGDPDRAAGERPPRPTPFAAASAATRSTLCPGPPIPARAPHAPPAMGGASSRADDGDAGTPSPAPGRASSSADVPMDTADGATPVRAAAAETIGHWRNGKSATLSNRAPRQQE